MRVSQLSYLLVVWSCLPMNESTYKKKQQTDRQTNSNFTDNKVRWRLGTAEVLVLI